MKPFSSILTGALLLAGMYGCTADLRQTSTMPPVPSSAVADNVRAGARLFSQHCASCHGANALGTSRAPSLRRETVQAMPDDDLVRFLTDGDLRNGMPSWSRLPLERRWQLVRFLKTFSADGGTTDRKRVGR